MQKMNPWVIARQTGIVLVAVLAMVFWFTADRGSSFKSFCDNIELGTQYDSVILLAESEDFSIPFYAKEESRITIFNKKGMLFEHGCTVDFINSKVVKTTYFEK